MAIYFSPSSPKVLKSRLLKMDFFKKALGYFSETADFSKIKIKVKTITSGIVATIVQNTALMWLGKNSKCILL